MYLGLTSTLVGLALCVGLFLLARWRAGQPVRPEKGPRLIPWTLIAIITAALFIALLVPLVELAGVDPSELRPRRV